MPPARREGDDCQGEDLKAVCPSWALWSLTINPRMHVTEEDYSSYVMRQASRCGRKPKPATASQPWWALTVE